MNAVTRILSYVLLGVLIVFAILVAHGVREPD
jgi:hypothetical protein